MPVGGHDVSAQADLQSVVKSKLKSECPVIQAAQAPNVYSAGDNTASQSGRFRG